MRAYWSVPAGWSPPSGGDGWLGPDALLIDVGALAIIEAARRHPNCPDIYVRISDVDGPQIEAELAASMPLAPTGLVLRARHGRDVVHLGARLAVHEALNALPDGGTRVIAAIADASAVMHAPSFRQASPRLSGLTWEPEALALQLGAECAWNDGDWIAPLAQARASVRLAAAAAGVEAIEAPCPADDEAGLVSHITAARRDGFGAIVLDEPGQIALVHARRLEAGSTAS